MIRHIIAAIAGVLTIGAILFMARLDSEVHKWQMIHQIIEKSKMEVHLKKEKVKNAAPMKQPAAKEESEAEKKLKVLKEKAGRMSAFEVSPLFRRNCASCHGINGGGGIGPKLVGKSEKYIYAQLQAFKSGKRKNYVMYGLLQNMNDDQLRSLAKEIAGFAAKLKAAQ